MSQVKNIKEDSKYEISNQLFGAFTVALGAGVVGFCVGYSSVIIHKLQLETGNLKITLDQGSWISTLFMVASIFSSIIGGHISSKIGRRKMFLYFNIPVILCWMMTALAVNIYMIYVGRLLLGLFVGAYFPSVGIFISETTHPNIRGSFSILQSLFLAIGILKAYTLGYFFTWTSVAWFGILEPLLCTLFIYFLPETPYWLIENGHEDEARMSMQYFRGKEYNIEYEIAEIIERKHNKLKMEDNKSNWKILCSREFYKPFSIIGILYGLCQFTGLTVLENYMSDIFEDSGSSLDPVLAPIIVGSFRTMISIIAFFVYQWSPKKILFILGSFGMAIGNLIIATFSYFKTHYNSPLMKEIGWIPLLGVLLVIGCFALGVIGVLQLTLAEIYPTEIRSLACGVTQATYNMIHAFNARAYPILLNWLDFYGTFYLYAGITVLMGIWGIIMLPENKGLSLVKVEKSMESTKNEIELSKV